MPAHAACGHAEAEMQPAVAACSAKAKRQSLGAMEDYGRRDG